MSGNIGFLCALAHLGAPPQHLQKLQRILFLGDSITQAGDYVTYFDASMVKRFPEKRFTIRNAGLSSETVISATRPRLS